MVKLKGVTTGHNKWKISFFILLSFNLLLLAVVGFFVYPLFQSSPVELPADSDSFAPTEGELQLHTNKEDLANFINAFFQEEEAKFTIFLEEDVRLKGDIQILHRDLPLIARFEPFVTSTGNLVLSLERISLGSITLPQRYILHHVSNLLDLPDWVLVSPEEELIYLNFQGINRQETRLRVERFDLKNDEIIFALSHRSQ